MNDKARKKKEFGDFQTPDHLAIQVCEKLKSIGIDAESIIEPTCGVGAFVIASRKTFPNTKIFGYEINGDYIKTLDDNLSSVDNSNIYIQQSDFFSTNWKEHLIRINGKLLVIGNFPWVTNSTQGSFESDNLPEKNNTFGFKGIDAITGKANFDISEWMLLESLSWFHNRNGTIAMLVKTAVARKIIAYAKKNNAHIVNASIYKINAKKLFDASVDACLMVLVFNQESPPCYDYSVFDSLNAIDCITIGHRDGLTISNLNDYNKFKNLLGSSNVKWRSGIKHDLSSVMELTQNERGYINGLGEYVDIESDLLYPLLKGSDIGSGKEWRNKFVIVTQKIVGMDTSYIKEKYPKTWSYLLSHSEKFDARASAIYKRNPQFSIFGVGDYSFKTWKIAICGLYKNLSFRFIEPIEGKPVQFDDTVYFISFNSREKAKSAYSYLTSDNVKKILSALIFWEDKRPVKASILNLLKWEE
ncbi:Uncharacterised protein [Canicola haemoglobinophilus]|uniref:site-specific DNA-methyltransferase (adenine-specific) n=1 Tax=Canicola haemoglobinophilus TaxID=733 RepID=A0AB38H941_9PAST|nr:N-6 DNA methylase [Canicola haemoglobinophilus]STO54229.1 Uncharacterised protein [Canicola haemoglobinophilus]STO68762.1 Uncharacterised protein [Canicola haemoglobinophilus]